MADLYVTFEEVESIIDNMIEAYDKELDTVGDDRFKYIQLMSKRTATHKVGSTLLEYMLKRG